jgi:hypothetical protein
MVHASLTQIDFFWDPPPSVQAPPLFGDEKFDNMLERKRKLVDVGYWLLCFTGMDRPHPEEGKEGDAVFRNRGWRVILTL